MTTTINAGGGDYRGLPTTPIEYRGARKPEGLPWDELTEQYVASGGQVDAGVWPKTGKVQIVETGRRGRDRVHTYAERGGYNEPAAPAKRPKKRTAKRTESAAPKRSLTDEQRAEIVQRYLAGENIPGLAVAYSVGVGSVAWALRHIKRRSHAEGRALAKAKAAS